MSLTCNQHIINYHLKRKLFSKKELKEMSKCGERVIITHKEIDGDVIVSYTKIACA